MCFCGFIARLPDAQIKGIWEREWGNGIFEKELKNGEILAIFQF
jgi:hypothetical protein